MKNVLPEEQRAKTWSHIIVVLVAAAAYGVLLYLGQIAGALSSFAGAVTPFLVGSAFAFIELPIVRKAERFFSQRVFRAKPHPVAARALATTLSTLILLGVISAFIGMLIPQLVKSIRSLVPLITDFVNEHEADINDYLLKYDLITEESIELNSIWENILATISQYVDVVLSNVMSVLSFTYSLLYNCLIGLVASFYLLLEKDHIATRFKKIAYAMFKRETTETMIYWTRKANAIFGGFTTGKIIDSLIIGIICYISMLILRLDYAVLISAIVGLTNFIPFFGPFIGAVPSVLILAIIEPRQALVFTIYILVLQQIDGNIIGPKILGDYVGISSLWIMISIVIGSRLFGFIGMLLSVPVFALIYAMVQTVTESRLKERGLPTETSAYADMPPKRDS